MSWTMLLMLLCEKSGNVEVPKAGDEVSRENITVESWKCVGGYIICSSFS
jgi:hypothetical protein